MKLWRFKFTLVDNPHKIKTWPVIPGYDKCEADRNFTILMTKKLGMNKTDFKVENIQEIKQ